MFGAIRRTSSSAFPKTAKSRARIMARRNGDGVQLYTRNGYDFAARFPQIVKAVSKLKTRSCFIDGEAIVVDERGLSTFDLLRSWRHDHAAVLCAFDLIEIDGKDLRRAPIEERKQEAVVFDLMQPFRARWGPLSTPKGSAATSPGPFDSG
jgi:hypothetical protein